MKLLGLLATRSAPIMQYDVPPPHRVGVDGRSSRAAVTTGPAKA